MSTDLGQALEKMLKRFKLKDKYEETKTLEDWENLVGQTIAADTSPSKIEKGKLFIKVDSPSWRNQLLFQKDYIKKQINQKMDKNLIKEIILR